MLRGLARNVPAVLSLTLAAACSGASASGEGSAARGERHELRLAAGTALALRADVGLTSRSNHVGDPVTATAVRASLSATGDTVIPAGATFHGTITAIAPAENPRGRGVLEVAFTSVRIGERNYAVRVQITSLATQRQGRGVTAGDAAKVGVGAVAGGIAGRIIGGNRTGTLIGAASGAAAGGVYANQTRDIDIVLPQGAAIRAKLATPFAPAVT